MTNDEWTGKRKIEISTLAAMATHFIQAVLVFAIRHSSFVILCRHQKLNCLQFLQRIFQIFGDDRGHLRAALAAGVSPGLLQLRKIFGILFGNGGGNVRSEERRVGEEWRYPWS